MTAKIPVDRIRAFRIAGALIGLAAALGACTHTDDVLTASVPNDYRQRHPIAIQEADQSVVIFVGHARGGLSVSQRADVMGAGAKPGFAKEPARSAPICRSPRRTRAGRPRISFREIQALLAAAGVPPRGIVVRRYHPDEPAPRWQRSG